MATTPHTPTNPNAALYAAIWAHPDTRTAAARVVEHLIEGHPDKAFRDAQRARNDMEDALSLIRGLVEIGPNVQALTLLARDAAEFVQRVEAQPAPRP